MRVTAADEDAEPERPRDPHYNGPELHGQMDDATHGAFVGYLAECVQALNLAGWRVDAARDFISPDSDAYAINKVFWMLKHSTIAIAEVVTSTTPETFRSIIAHELMHCHLGELNETVDSIVGEHTGQAVQHDVEAKFERAVDTCAALVEDRLPLPPKRLCGDLTRADLSMGWLL